MLDSTIQDDLESIIARLGSAGKIFYDKKVLISGGGGFLGSWLCDVLVKLNADVICLDNFSTGKMENIDHLLSCENFRLVNHDVCTFNSEEKFDFVLHFASRASPEDYQLHPVETLMANSLGTLRMLEATLQSSAVMLYASTSEVYGDPSAVPTPESYWGWVNPVGVRSCYDEGKRFGEALCMAFHREFKVNVRIARIFNSYGSRLRSEGAYGRALSRFISQALAGKDITVYGDGSQTRSFCYVEDTIVGLISFLTCEEAEGETVNVGSPFEVSILELAKLVKRLTRSNSRITFHSLPEDDPKRRQPNLEKATRLFGFEVKVGLEEGLKRTANWVRQSS